LKDSKLTEERISGEVVYTGKFFQVHRDQVRLPDGTQAVRDYLKHPGAVAIVALNAQDEVLLERQHRYPVGRDFVEIPAGKLDPGESHLETAKRELLEETGYTAAHWTRLGLIHNAIGYSDEGIELWLATGLQTGAAQLDPGEFLEVFALPFKEAVAMATDGRISDVKTIIGLLWTASRR
jgi:ADP-ribose pyrophosphatase